MMRCGFFWMIFLFCTVCAPAVEHLDRGLLALPMNGGKIYVGWRLLAEDPSDIAFHIYRSEKADAEFERVTATPLSHSTNWVDSTTQIGKTYFYRVTTLQNELEGMPSKPAEVTAAKRKREYMDIQFWADYEARMCAIADLDGNGAYYYIIKQPSSTLIRIKKKATGSQVAHAIR